MDLLISRDVVIVLMCLMLVGLMMFLTWFVACLKMALDARLLLYAMRSAVIIVRMEKSNFIDRNNSFIDTKLKIRSGWKIQSGT